ncbi:hypothetical protein M3Y98_00170700 [Aphelenchoides besseyi]|nr:hypothetical protein M3Y98_00170700 [Aphelenchoides besseyi]KAI6200000.1 hypothetical protein M3Y96_00687000 [Aphelenchoides besseyi]
MQSKITTLNFIFLFFLCMLSIHEVMARRRKCPENSWSEGQIVTELMSNYTKMLPDTEGNMGSLNEITADFQIDILFTQYWHDPSLSFTNHSQCIRNITMEPKFLNKIWTPNTCIINSKASVIHSSPTENVMVIIYDNGTVWINHRLSVKAPCQLDLRTFPFDTQTCTLEFESYSHNNEEVSLHWMEEPITLMKMIQLPDFDMVQFDTKREISLYPNGYWDQLQAIFTFKRRYGFYILQAYVPTYLTIIVSWVSFCMEPNALPARTTVGVSSLLAITMMFGNILKNLPRVSYVKAMDVWMLGCISFVFATMVELAFVCYITRCQNPRRRGEYGGVRSMSMPGHCHSVSSSQSSMAGMTGNTYPTMGAAFGCMSSREMVPGQTAGSLRYRPHPLANGVCGSARGALAATESAHGSLLNYEQQPRTGSSNRRPSQAFHGNNGSIGGNTGANYRQSSPSPPPNGRLLSNGSPPVVGTTPTANYDLYNQTSPLTFEQINGYQHAPVYSRSLTRRRNLLAIAPESVDKASLVCFPLAFTFFNAIYWWYYTLLH